MPDLLINVVLDRSGSMVTARDATIAGFNELLNSQSHQDGQTYVSLTLFNESVELRHIVLPLSDVPPLTKATYTPSGWTALYDAVGDSIRAIEGATNLPEKVLFVVITDGMENASTRWSQKELFDLVKKKQADNWAFMFMGCDIDAYGAGAQLGIARNSTVNFTATQTYQNYSLVSDSAAAYRKGALSPDNLAHPNDS